jgi:hypothetical protein
VALFLLRGDRRSGTRSQKIARLLCCILPLAAAQRTCASYRRYSIASSSLYSLCVVFVICVPALENSMMFSMMLSMMLFTEVDLGWAPHQVRMFKFEAPQGALGEMLKPLQAFAMESCEGNCVFDRPTCQV